MSQRRVLIPVLALVAGVGLAIAQAPSGVAADKGAIFKAKGCVACHSISKLGVTGGKVGPDLSTAAKNVPAKYKMSLDAFLTKPTSPTMKGVIGASIKLTPADRAAIVNALK